jgi:hypothetical protein
MHRFGPVAAGFLAIAGTATADTYFSELTLAAIRGEAEKVEAILRWGGNPNHRGWLDLAPLAAAMRSCATTPEVIYALVKGGADIEVRSGIGATPLMIAWQTGRADLAEMLLALGADPAARNVYGDTARAYERFFTGEMPADEFQALRYTSLGSSGGSGTCEDPGPSR